jgi:hypothetical protein
VTWTPEPGLAELVEANAWTFGPCATAREILAMTVRRGLDPEEVWPPLIAACPRLAPLGYWRQALAHGADLKALASDHRTREKRLVAALDERLGGRRRILVCGHDREIDGLWRDGDRDRTWRYLLLDDGPDHAPAPGSLWTPGMVPAALEPALPFARLEEALEWAEAVVLAGFILHRWNILGPAQLHPLITAARDQVGMIVLAAINERRLVLGEGAPHRYSEDFRPWLWQHQITHLVSEWADGSAGTVLGWLPMPPEVLEAALAGGVPEGGA